MLMIWGILTPPIIKRANCDLHFQATLFEFCGCLLTDCRASAGLAPSNYVGRMSVIKKTILSGFVSGILCCSLNVLAAGPTTSGGVESSLGRRPQLQAPAPVPGELVAPQKAAKRESVAGPKVSVKQIVVLGNNSISDQELAVITGEYLGKELTLGEIYQIADRITALYRERGFPLATTTVPAQKISAGNVNLEVVEGRLEKFSFAGNSTYSNELLGKHLSDGLAAGQVLTTAAMERELLLLNDMPGLTARSVIKPGASYGTSDILIESQEQPYTGRLALNNFGPENIGEWRGEGSFVANNPFGIGDSLSLDMIRSESGLLDFYSVGYSIPVSTKGTRLAISHSKVDFDIAGALKALGIDGESDNTRLQLSHPLLRTRQENLLVGLGLTHKESETDALGSNIAESDLTMLDISGIYSVVHPDRSVSNLAAVFWTNFRSNSDGLKENRILGKLRVDANHIRPITDDWNLFARIAAVVSMDPLVDSEKFSLGGPGDIRAFPSSEVRGDQGASLTLEAQYPFIPYQNMNALFRTFWDIGKVHSKDPLPGIDSTDSLSAFGLGVTILPRHNLQVDLTWARPLNGRDVSDGDDSGRIWSNLTMSF